MPGGFLVIHVLNIQHSAQIAVILALRTDIRIKIFAYIQFCVTVKHIPTIHEFH